MAAEHGLDIEKIPRDRNRRTRQQARRHEVLGIAAPRRIRQRATSSFAYKWSDGSTYDAASRAGETRHAVTPSAPPTPGGYHPPVYQPREGDIVEPFTRRRKLIAEHMVYSKTHSPHVGTLAEVDLTKLVRLRETHKKAFHEREGFSLTMLPLAAAATVRALKEFPRMNASAAGDALVIRKQINLGIAMDSDEGLLVPVIKGRRRDVGSGHGARNRTATAQGAGKEDSAG